MAGLEGKVVAMVCRGGDADRAIAVALAEAGANLSLGTITSAKDEEFATASISNEVWAIGREQFNTILDATDPAAAAAFAAEVVDRLGRCDALVVAPGATPMVEFDELSRDEWDAISASSLTAPLVVSHAFAPVIERGGGGTIIFVVDAAPHGDVAGSVVTEGLRAMAANMGIAWSDRSLRALLVSREGAPEQIVTAFD